MKKGHYIKAKIKFIEKEVYSYELTKRGMFGSDRIRERNDGELVCTYFGSREADWQLDACKVIGFAKRFIWAQNLARTQPKEFHFEYDLKKEHKY